MSKRLIPLTAAMAAAAIALAGCATLPMSSGVHAGPSIQQGLSSDYLYYSPSGPVKGESEADILAGFLNASTGPQNDYAVARQYLVPTYRTAWRPNDRLYIQRGGQKTSFSSTSDATVRIGVSAEVDANGHYISRNAGSNVDLKFKLVQVNGQWRIAQAPNAVVMIRPVFEVIFKSYAVYFFDRSYTYLIPDLRWFPARASTGTRLVAATLAGPSAWLSSAVAPTMPSNTQLAIESVTADKKVAQVNLSPQALQASKLAKQRFKAQLTATLGQLDGIRSVQVLIDSTPISIDDYSPASTSSGAYAPIALSGNSLDQLIGPNGSRLSNAQPWLSTYSVKDFAVTADQTSVALVGKDGVYSGRLDEPTAAVQKVDKRTDLLPPKYDRRGQLWLMGRDGRLQIVQSTGTSIWLNPTWLKSGKVDAFAVSPEGARLATLTTDAQGVTHLWVQAVVRNELGVVTALGTPSELSYGVGTPRSIEWAGATGLLVLADVSASESNLTRLTIGGDPTEIGTLDLANSVMSSDDGSNIYVLTPLGTLLEYRGYTWSVLDTQVTAAHMVN